MLGLAAVSVNFGLRLCSPWCYEDGVMPSVAPDAKAAIEAAERIADAVLFSAALEVDASDRVPLRNLEMLAEAGLFGVAGPADAGGLNLDIGSVGQVIEALAGGCMATTFVWIQHHSPVRALSTTTNAALREEWLVPLCAGQRRGGIALGGLRPEPPFLVATPVAGGWSLAGRVPWVTGWGLIDTMLTAARTVNGQALRALVDPAESETLRVRRLHLVAVNASVTVEVEFRGHFVPHERVVALEPYTPPPAHDGGGRFNGSLALGLARRCCRLIGPSALDEELVARRRQLDEATDETIADARAAACELAMRAAATLVVATGSSSLLVESHAQRLAREALFVLVFGSRPAIRSSLLRRLVR